MVGEHISRFEICRELGRGGSGRVYDAIDPTLGRHVAIKVLDDSARPDSASRLLREAQALAKLSHPNVVAIYEAGTDAEHVYLVMELVVGATARNWCEGRSRDDVVGVYRQAASGLAAAHRAGLVHRDVKPDNIFVGDDGRTRIGDFGLVATFERTEGEPDPEDLLTRTGMVLGTPAYMSPEAHRREPLDARSDQFSLCVALWEALTGARPFAAKTYRELYRAVQLGEVTGVEQLSPMLRAALVRGLAVDPAKRWSSIDALFDAIDICEPKARRRWPRFAVGGLVLVAGGAAFSVHRDDPPRAAPIRIATNLKCPGWPTFVDATTLVVEEIGAGGSDLYRVELGGESSLLVGSPDMDWRPGPGRHAGEAVFARQHAAGNAELTYVDLATGRLEPTGLNATTAVSRGRDLYYMRFDGVEVRRLREGRDDVFATVPEGRTAYSFALSADGARVAVLTVGERRRPALCVGAGSAMTCRDDEPLVSSRVAFDPDGAIYAPGTTRVVREDGELRTTIADGVAAWGGVAVSPDGRYLVYSDCTSRTRVRPVGGGAPLAEGNLSDVAGNGTGAIVFVRDIGATRHIVFRDARGERVLTPASLAWVSQPALAPDGRHVAFKVDGDAPGIYVVAIDPLPPERITTHPRDGYPVWTVDGRIAFTRWSDDANPHVMIASRGRGTEGDDARRPVHPGQRIAMELVAATGELVLRTLDNRQLYLWNPDTGVERSLATLPQQFVFHPAVTPDGEWLLVPLGGWGEELWRVPIPKPGDTRTPSQLERLPEGNSGERPIATSTTSYVSDSEWRGSLWLVEL